MGIALSFTRVMDFNGNSLVFQLHRIRDSAFVEDCVECEANSMICDKGREVGRSARFWSHLATEEEDKTR